ncbi:hypothetical protein [Actinomadura keratinilytica]|jgi:hypothetical protein
MRWRQLAVLGGLMTGAAALGVEAPTSTGVASAPTAFSALDGAPRGA